MQNLVLCTCSTQSQHFDIRHEAWHWCMMGHNLSEAGWSKVPNPSGTSNTKLDIARATMLQKRVLKEPKIRQLFFVCVLFVLVLLWLFFVFIVFIIPKWLINASGWIAIFFGLFLELPRIDQIWIPGSFIYYRNTSKHIRTYGNIFRQYYFCKYKHLFLNFIEQR